jgi:hypothetical protein
MARRTSAVANSLPRNQGETKRQRLLPTLTAMNESGLIHRRSIRVRLADLPGALHQLTSLVADAGVNIVRLEVVSREHPEVWDDIELTAENEEQLDDVVALLKESGVTVIGLPRAWAIRDWAVDVLHSLETLGRAAEGSSTVDQFADTAASLANVEHAFVLMEPAQPDAAAAEARWRLIQEAAEAFDPDKIKWSGDAAGSRIVISAMRAARSDAVPRRPDDLADGVGAVVRIPMSARRPAHLVVVGRRPAFLAPELSRLELFAQVAAPHLWVAPVKATA